MQERGVFFTPLRKYGISHSPLPCQQVHFPLVATATPLECTFFRLRGWPYPLWHIQSEMLMNCRDLDQRAKTLGNLLPPELPKRRLSLKPRGRFETLKRGLLVLEWPDRSTLLLTKVASCLQIDYINAKWREHADCCMSAGNLTLERPWLLAVNNDLNNLLGLWVVSTVEQASPTWKTHAVGTVACRSCKRSRLQYANFPNPNRELCFFLVSVTIIMHTQVLNKPFHTLMWHKMSKSVLSSCRWYSHQACFQQIQPLNSGSWGPPLVAHGFRTFTHGRSNNLF